MEKMPHTNESIKDKISPEDTKRIENYDEAIQNASPHALRVVGRMLLDIFHKGETGKMMRIGTLATVMGGFMLRQTFGEGSEAVVQNLEETLSDPEQVRRILLALKTMSASMFSLGVTMFAAAGLSATYKEKEHMAQESENPDAYVK